MATEDTPAQKRKLLANPLVLIGSGVLGILLIAAGVLWWLHARQFESTDDAFIDAHVVRLAPQLAGQVIAVLVDDNQLVQQGQPLLLINPDDAEAGVAAARALRAQAEAQASNARAQVLVNAATLRQSRAELAAAAAQARIARLDLARFERLTALNPAAVAPQQLDQTQATASQEAAQQDAAQHAVEVRAQMLAASQTMVAAADAQVQSAAAQFDTAAIGLGHARIAAPLTGHVAQKSVAVGAYVQPGTELMAIVPVELWVTANFKETQLAHMRAGQEVMIHVDACEGASIRGHVDSIERGAGQAFAILPPENATGNYVKVVQRVPVKILMDSIPKTCLLGPGMSVQPQVRVR
jgi:membrane fusion protein (multidrug efflux system)